jgi:hydroxyethylthiazole kinase-like uncharacterized protein yjeF
MSFDSFTKTIVTDANAAYLGIPIDKLMEKAGEGIARELVNKYGKAKSYNFICGLGNNGGDGFVAARHLVKNGVKDVSVYLVGRITDIKSKAAIANFEKLRIVSVNLKVNTDVLARDIEQAEVSVECLVGTGIKGNLHKRFKDVIVRLTKQRTKIVAIDCPVPGYKPDFAISMLYPKVENAVVLDIGMPKEAELYTGPGDVKVLKVPEIDSYKSQNGELFVYAGSRQFHGAPLMTIKAASKLIGSIFFYTNPENRELTQHLKLGLEEFIVMDDNQVEKYAGYANAFLFGPGLEENLPTKAVIAEILRRYPEKPAILDAYAISVARDKGLLKNKILTPHRGELRHIFGDDKNFKKLGSKGVEGKLKRFAVENECYIVLKGHVDILFSKDGEIALNKTGNAGMAKGGTGDILAGIMAALITQNDIWTSIRAACFINGKAGDNLYEKYGFNYSATDLITEVQKVIEWCRKF